MADDLSTVASLLKDTNKKLDKLHSDNEQNDTKGDIIKGALPEILSDTINTQRNIGTINARQKEEKDRDVAQMKADKGAADGQLKILGEIKKPMIDLGEIKQPMIDLGLAIPKSGFNAFSEKASDISAEKALPSDFKLMLQALTPKALTQGFKVGLGDMFKELGGGIKNIGRGIKSLGSKGLTAAQRKSEEKEKESKDNKKDSFFKKQLGSTVKLLGGILKTAKLAGKAGFLALLGAGALFALAKLMESPSWKTVAGHIEYVLNGLDDIFTWANKAGGPLGVIGIALAGWYGTKGILILAGIALKALGKKLLGKLGLTAATKAATTALGATGPAGMGLLAKLGLLGLGFAAAGTAIYFLGEELDKFRKKAADKRAIKRADKTTKALKQGDPAELKKLQEEVEMEKKLADQLRSSKARDEAKAKIEADLKRIKAAQAEALKKTQTTREAAVFGGTPKQISENLAKLFKDAFNSTTFEGNAEQRVGQVKGLIGGISKRLLTSKAFQNLSDIDKQGFLKKLLSAESGAFNLVKGLGPISRQTNLGRGGGVRSGMDKPEEKKLMFALRDLQKEQRALLKSQIGKLTANADAVDADANAKKMKLLIDRLERNAMAGHMGGGSDVIGSGNNTLITNNLSTPMVAPLVTGTAGKGQLMLYGNPF